MKRDPIKVCRASFFDIPPYIDKLVFEIYLPNENRSVFKTFLEVTQFLQSFYSLWLIKLLHFVINSLHNINFKSITNVNSILIKHLTNSLQSKLECAQEDYPEQLNDFCSMQYEHDWPATKGDLNLFIHDLPHLSNKIEWWYINTHLQSSDYANYTFFFSIFRIYCVKSKSYHHFCITSLGDINNKKYFYESFYEKGIEKVFYELLKEANEESSYYKYLQEVLRESLPLPDKLTSRPFSWDKKNLYFKTEYFKFYKKNNNYYVKVCGNNINISLVLIPKKKAIRHGSDGLTSLSDNTMYYYSIPYCESYGHISQAKNKIRLRGKAWYDHQFGMGNVAAETKSETKLQNSWEWFSIQFENDTEITLFDMYQSAECYLKEQVLKIIDKNNNVITYTHFITNAKKYWYSNKTFIKYPIAWEIIIPEANITINIEALLANQEIVTVATNPAFYEGGVKAVLQHNHEIVPGFGFVERNGFARQVYKDHDAFIAASVEYVRHILEDHISENMLPAQITDVLARNYDKKYIANVPTEYLRQTIIDPICSFINRGGKKWRSIIFLACINAVGGDSDNFRDFIIVVEFIHNGALIIDDIEDNSTLRRGELVLHKIYGTPLAINLGSLMYFLYHNIVDFSQLSDDQRIESYQNIYDCMNSAHIGQALDINGIRKLLHQAIATQNNEELMRLLEAIHYLKTGVGPRAAGRIGAIFGNGTKEQIDAVGDYMAAVGLAFQYMDDVLALKGFKDNSKHQGEDLLAGKITLPIVKAIPKLNDEERNKIKLFYESLNPESLTEIIEILNRRNIFQECHDFAEKIVAEAWDSLSPHLPDSIYKAFLYQFGYLAVHREY